MNLTRHEGLEGIKIHCVAANWRLPHLSIALGIRVREHVHLVTSRIDNGGQAWTGKWEALRLIAVTQELEHHTRQRIHFGKNGRRGRSVRRGQLECCECCSMGQFVRGR